MLQYVEITGDFAQGDGSAATGTVQFVPSQPVYYGAQPLLSSDSPVQCSVIGGQLQSADGGPVTLLATDNSGLSLLTLTGFWWWEVTVTLDGQDPETFAFALPSSPATVDLFSLANTSYSGGGGGGGSGTVTSVSVEAANGFSGTVANAATTPEVTLGTTVTGLLKGNGTAVSAATAGTDYLALNGSGAALTGITASQVGADASGAAASVLAYAESHVAGTTVLVPAPTGVTATDTPNVTSAIMSLVSALGSGPATLQFQDGTYQIDSNAAVIQSLSNFTVRGNGGTVISQAPNRTALPNNTTGNIFTIADSTDFRVEGLTLDGMRDTVAPLTPLTATAASGQPSVTVAAGQGANYQVGQRLALYGGLGSSDQALQEGEQNGWGGTGLVIASISAGAGAGGGDLITFTSNLANSYTQISSTALSDGFGPYAYTGAYLTPYQSGYQNSVAARSLSGEDQQCGLHLIACQRFTVTKVTSRNVWESPIKCGAGWSGGFEIPALADGCSQGTISDCISYHAYDQGVSLWLSNSITVTGCKAIAAGWSGVSLSSSDFCTVTGNAIANSVYRVPKDNNSGSGVSIEGGIGNTVTGNVIRSPYQYGVILWGTVLPFGLPGGTGNPSTTAFVAAAAAAGTSIAVSSTSKLQAGGLYSLVDGSRTEAVTVASIVDSTHVTFASATRFPHLSGTYFAPRVPQDNVIAGNVIAGMQTNNGIQNQTAVRTVIDGNIIRDWNSVSGGNQGINMVAGTNSAGQFPTSTRLGGDGSRITGNTIGPPGPTGNHHLLIDSSGDHVIEGNHIIGTCIGNTNPLKLQGVYDTIVSGNSIHDTGDTSASSQQGIQLITGTSNALPCQRVTVTGNTVTHVKNEGILLLGGDSITITDNKVSSCGGNAGIDLRGVANSTVAGNVSSSNAGAGIELESNSGTGCTNIRVIGNTCRNDGTGYSTKTGVSFTQVNGILESGGSDFNVFANNECDGNSSAQLTLTGAHSAARNNILSGSAIPPAVTTPAVPATTVAQQNTTGHDIVAYITGGTVTSITAGTTITGLTGGMVIIPAGQTITLAYSAAPTWTWMAVS